MVKRVWACPFHAVTGWWCPGCGMTRATYELVTGHPMSALGDNLLWPLAAVVVGWLVLSWMWPRLPRPTRVPVGAWFGIALVTLAFGALRNLPAFAALAP
jgi:uncharacterized membrane protein YhhN